MLKSATGMKGLTIKATDGEIGKVDQFLFDDENWAVRYLVVRSQPAPFPRPHEVEPRPFRSAPT